MSHFVTDDKGSREPRPNILIVASVEKTEKGYIATVSKSEDYPRLRVTGSSIEECSDRIRQVVELALSDGKTVRKFWHLRINLTKIQWKKIFSYVFSILLAVLNLLDTIDCLKLLDYRGAAIYSSGGAAQASIEAESLSYSGSA